MRPVAVVLGDGWADWEAGHLLGAAGYFLATPATIVTPRGTPVRSAGGLRTSADLSIGELVPSECSAIALIGGPVWLEPVEGITDLLRQADDAGVPLGGICAGTLPLAQAGLLDVRRHTSNGMGYLDANVREYRGADHYVDSPAAVVDRRVVTAPGTAPTTFAVGLLRLAAPGADAVLDGLLAHSAREHGARGGARD